MADQSAQPAYVFVGGTCHTPELFGPLIAEMEKHGITSTAVRLPTVGDNTEGKTQLDEIKAIRDSILDFLDGHNRDVVLVSHSYSGWPASRAVKSLDKETRLAQGATTGIVELVFIAGFLVPDNAATKDYSYSPVWLSKQGDVGTMTEMVKSVFMHDLTPEKQDFWFSHFKPHRMVYPEGTSPDAPWHLSIPKTYIMPTAELAPAVALEFGWLKGVLDATWTIKSIKACHEPFLSKPTELALVLLSPSY